MPLNVHQKFIDTVISRLTPDIRFLGLAAGGSWLTKEIDAYSDLDLMLVCDNAHHQQILEGRGAITESFGPVLSQFTGEHVGTPNLTIALFDDPLLHVDLKFESLDGLRTRIENPVVLWERNGALTRIMEETQPHTPHLDLQWVEDRFWTWIHYGAQRLGRGELFETISTLALLREHALGPMENAYAGKTPRGVRRLEMLGNPRALDELRATVAAYNPRSCEQALKAAAKMYVGLRETLDKGTLKRNRRAEVASLRYLHEISEKI